MTTGGLISRLVLVGVFGLVCGVGLEYKYKLFEEEPTTVPYKGTFYEGYVIKGLSVEKESFTHIGRYANNIYDSLFGFYNGEGKWVYSTEISRVYSSREEACRVRDSVIDESIKAENEIIEKYKEIKQDCK